MTEKTVSPNEAKKIASADKLTEPVLIVGVIACYSQIVKAVWEFIKDPVEFIADLTGGEYSAYDVFKSIWFGQSFLYVGYMCYSKEDVDFAGKDEGNASLIVAKYTTIKREKDFVGYMVVRLDDVGAHIWQAYITKEFHGTDVFARSFEVVKKNLTAIGVKRYSFTSKRQGWADKVKPLGFTEGMTTFHMSTDGEDQNNDHITV